MFSLNKFTNADKLMNSDAAISRKNIVHQSTLCEVFNRQCQMFCGFQTDWRLSLAQELCLYCFKHPAYGLLPAP